MKIPFTEIPERIPYPANVKTKISIYLSGLVQYFKDCYTGRFTQRSYIIRCMNSVAYHVINADQLPDFSNIQTFLNQLDMTEEDVLADSLKSLYLIERQVIWDIPVHESMDISKTPSTPPQLAESPIEIKSDSNTVKEATDKSDLYIQPPAIPQFDTSSPVVAGVIDSIKYAIYPSYPRIPKKQNQISATTDMSLMSDTDYIHLYPSNFIQTRASTMYQPTPGIELHPQLGLILPIQGYTRDQLIDNIIKYPHLFRLLKCIDNEVVSFYKTIEIDGSLYPVSEIWNDLPESSIIPYTADFVKEYVVRRYLLERDISNVKHRYLMYGSLDPFLTLFSTTDDYIRWGYPDILDIAKSCVRARISYKQSRNPVIRKLVQHG